MKTRSITMFTFVLILLGLVCVIYARLHPVREYHRLPPYNGPKDFSWSRAIHRSDLKTVVVMADNNMTEFFDMVAPFDLFSRTGLANVYVVAQEKNPITTENGPFVLPHYTYSELDSSGITPDVIVIPYMDTPESELKTAWIKKHYTDSVILLSICDGAWTAAATGLYDGRPLTSHATGHDKLKARFSKPAFIQNVTFTEDENLFSTGGVSNATDGSLAVIRKLMGEVVMQRVLSEINYPYSQLNQLHVSASVDFSVKQQALKKVIFNKNRSIGVLLQDGMNELEIGALFDTYSRSMPSSIRALTTTGTSVMTRHGLTLLADETLNPEKIDELHVLNGGDSEGYRELSKKANVVAYDNSDSYIIDQCLRQIAAQYGNGFAGFVKRMLDYN